METTTRGLCRRGLGPRTPLGGRSLGMSDAIESVRVTTTLIIGYEGMNEWELVGNYLLEGVSFT